jgi:hypothetical protein
MRKLAYVLFIIVGTAMIILAVWLDTRDGVPTTTRGEQPFEVVLTGGIGIALLGNGVYRLWRDIKRDNEDRRS